MTAVGAKNEHPLRGGLLLIEVVCATLIAGTLLAAVLSAASSQSRQIKSAEFSMVGTKVLDDLLREWERRDALGRVDPNGAVPGHEGWEYRTRIVRKFEIYDVPVVQFRVAVHQESDEVNGEPRPSRDVSVELILPRGSFDP